MAAGFAEAAAPVAAGLAATGVVFLVAVASAAFFFVGIVAFRSDIAAASAAAVLLEIFCAAGALLGAFGVALVLASDAFAPDFDFDAGLATALRDATGADFAAGLALAVVGFGAGFTVAPALVEAELFAAARLVAVLAVVALAAAGLDRAVEAAGRAALARLTEAAGCVADRAAALDGAAGLAVRPVTEADLDALAVLVAALLTDSAFAAVRLLVAAFAVAGLVVAGLAAAALATLRSRAAGLVFGDISATPEIGRPAELRDRRRRAGGGRARDDHAGSRRRRLGKFDRLPARLDPA